MRQFFPFLALAGALFLSSCASNSPETRIERNQQIYNSLALDEQELVSQGRIAEGMNPDAVLLALGRPDRELEGFAEGTRTRRWDYNSLAPVYQNNFYSGFGYGSGFGRGRYGRGGFYNSVAFGPSINYVPVRSGTVWFENDRVKSWERIRD